MSDRNLHSSIQVDDHRTSRRGMRAAHFSPLRKVMEETTLKLPEAYLGLTMRERLDEWILVAMEAGIYEFYGRCRGGR